MTSTTSETDISEPIFHANIAFLFKSSTEHMYSMLLGIGMWVMFVIQDWFGFTGAKRWFNRLGDLWIACW